MIQFRKAHINDLALLQYWDNQPHVHASDPGEDDWNWAEELKRHPDWRELLIAELNGRPIGFIQIIDPQLEDTHYWGNIGPDKRAIDIWIGEAEDLGRGYGTIMMSLALDRCFNEEQVTEVLIDPLSSNTKAIRFYKRLGFHFVENRNFDGDECEIYVMSRQIWEKRNG